MKLQNLHQPSTLDRLKQYPYPASAPGIVLPSCHTEFLSTLNSTKLLEAVRFLQGEASIPLLLGDCCWKRSPIQQQVYRKSADVVLGSVEESTPSMSDRLHLYHLAQGRNGEREQRMLDIARSTQGSDPYTFVDLLRMQPATSLMMPN